MKQVFYITNGTRGSGVGGREQLSELHRQVLLDLFGEDFECIVLSDVASFGKLFGYLNGVSRGSIDLICRRILESGCKQVFLDGSNLGRLAEGIKRRFPDVEVLTFFHNCEARFFFGAFRLSKSPRALAVLFANYLAERSAVRFSDKRICLSQRDGDQLVRLFGFGATHISAMAMQDRRPKEVPAPESLPVEKYALFVGGAFYANQAGIEWFCRNVSPHIPIETRVVGKGLDAARSELEKFANVEVVGEVKDLAPLYMDAHVVVAPIFDGSGMKTKVAEALMFGKRVLGTPEAFSGYEAHIADVGVVCHSRKEFIAAIADEVKRNNESDSAKLRKIYEENYSFVAARRRLKSILEKDSRPVPGQLR